MYSYRMNRQYYNLYKSMTFLILKSFGISPVFNNSTNLVNTITFNYNSWCAERQTTTIMPVIYHKFEEIQNFLDQPEYRDLEQVKKLWEVYNNVKKDQNGDEILKNHPLIVIEGLDGSGKTTITTKLAEKIKATLYRTPPRCMDGLRGFFDDYKPLRRAFYAMGNYIAAEEIKKLLTERPVVLDRFWHSTAAYALAQAVQNDPENFTLPSKGDVVYQWPEDLLKPNISLFLSVSEQERIRRHSRRNTTNTAEEKLLKGDDTFRKNVIKAYEYMHNPPLEIVDSNTSVEENLEDVYQKVKDLIL